MGASSAIGQKKLLQASSDVCKLGVSPTMQHVYDVYVSRTKIVVASNVWASELEKLPKREADWLQENSTCVHVHDEPLWIA